MTKIVSELVYEVANLVSGSREIVHAARLLHYRPDLEGTEVSQHLLRHAEHSEAKYEEREKFLDLDEGEHGIMVLTQ